VTAFNDGRSRRTVGCVVSVQPNSDTILAAFAQGASKYGLPEEVLIDNGKDYLCQTFAGGRRKLRVQVDEARVGSMLSRLKVKPHFATPYNAKSKPIERAFRTVKEHFSRLWVYPIAEATRQSAPKG
jgi:putative transposase